MVSRGYLEERRALAVNAMSRDDIAAAINAKLVAGLPGWDGPNADTILGQAVDLIAEEVFLWLETANRNWNNGTLLRAAGPYLDEFGIGIPSIPRQQGESDDDYRFRMANSSASLSLGSLSAIEALARSFNSDIVDVQAVTATNRQNVLLYALKADHTALTSGEQTALSTHLNARENSMAGVTLTTPAVTQTAFTINVNISHSSQFASDAILADARAAIYAWLATVQRIGQPIYRVQVQAAALVGGASTVAITAPANDLAATNGTAYTCASNETDVVIATTRLT